MANDNRQLRGIISMEHYIARYRRVHVLNERLYIAEQIAKQGLIPKEMAKDHLKEINKIKKEIKAEKQRIKERSGGGSFEGCNNIDKPVHKKAMSRKRSKSCKTDKGEKEELIEKDFEHDNNNEIILDDDEVDEVRYEYDCEEEVDLNSDDSNRWARVRDEEY
jgi:phosphopantothenoylcysteine synthetase/decarboxylase